MGHYTHCLGLKTLMLNLIFLEEKKKKLFTYIPSTKGLKPKDAKTNLLLLRENSEDSQCRWQLTVENVAIWSNIGL